MNIVKVLVVLMELISTTPRKRIALKYHNYSFDVKSFDAFYEISSDCRQCIYSLVGDNVVPPDKGTEIFIGDLPRDLLEDELFALFSKVGLIYKMRFMLNGFGQTRGFAFLQFCSEEVAHLAVSTLNNHIIRTDKKISVCLSMDNRRLFLGRIPREMTVEKIKSKLQIYVEGIVDVILYQDRCNPIYNRGFAFVEFESHLLAARARTSLTGSLFFDGRLISVNWADPIPDLTYATKNEVGF